MCVVFQTLLNFIPMKEKYDQKVAFLHGLQPWVHKSINQRNEVPKTCQEMMKIVKCMEDDLHFVGWVGTRSPNNKRGMLGIIFKL